MRRCAAVLAFVLAASPGFGCGPDWSPTIFFFFNHPDTPKTFAAGQLGIVLPTFDKTYQVMVYRALMGIKLDAAQVAAVLKEWGTYNAYGPDPSPEEAVTAWGTARKKVEGSKDVKQIDAFREYQPTDAWSILNCPTDAFRTAGLILDERIARYGAASGEVKEWLAGQDAVFANCTFRHTEFSVPSPLAANVPAELRADRDYQIAAANFYAMRYPQARALFLAIGKDKSSPWARFGTYLAARALIRQATMQANEGFDRELMQQAEAELASVRDDPGSGSLRSAARGLINFIEFRLHPAERMHALASEVVRTDSGAQLAQDLRDYTWLLGRGTKPSEPDDLTDWMVTFHHDIDCETMDMGSGPCPPQHTPEQLQALRQHTLERWQAKHSLSWLVAAITFADKDVAGLSDAALKLTVASPAYLTARYHAARLLISSGKKDEARRALDALLAAGPAAMPLSTRNLFLAERAQTAATFDDWLRDMQRQAVDLGGGAGQGFSSAPRQENELLFDTAAAVMLNRHVPLEQLLRTAQSNVLAPNLRRRVVLSGWTRAALLNDAAHADAFAEVAGQLAPELALDMRRYRAAAAPDKHFTALFIVLQHPGLRPALDSGLGRTLPLATLDSMRENWWCSDAGLQPGDDNLGKMWSAEACRTQGVPRRAVTEPAAPSFLTEAAREQADKEYRVLAKLGVAPTYLANEAVAWARAHPEDARNAQALHLSVRATRYGCTDDKTTAASKAAFELLHRQYPKSEWAKKTPYYF